MGRSERQADILILLKKLGQGNRDLSPLKELFWTELNYRRINSPISRRIWPDTAAKALATDPVLLAAAGRDKDFRVIYAQLDSDRLQLGAERPVVSRLLQDHPYALFVFSDSAQKNWHFVNVKHDDERDKRRLFRRITIGPDEQLRTACERIAMLDVADDTDWIQALRHPLGVNDIQQRHDQAFDVEEVGQGFYRGYQDRFCNFVDAIGRSNKGKAHFMGDRGKQNVRRFTQLLLGRVLFLYFIQKKRWLNSEPEFLFTRFAPYQDHERRSYYWDILEPLFFEGLNRPGKYKTILNETCTIPYLNGGLFEPQTEFFEADRLKHPMVPNAQFKDLFTFLNSYNFTVAESTPLDQDVDIDPEMLGRVFENLLVAEDRHASGTYYTPRSIVSFMCRESIFQYLSRTTGLTRALYDDLFEAPLDGSLPKLNADVARHILISLQSIRILDPAAGSGAFLLGALHELIHLRTICGRMVGESETVQAARIGQWKREIVGNNIFGVDIKPEACEIARLRLWLSLVVDEPEASPLPNLDYRIVQGDTLREHLDGEPIVPPQTGPGFEKEHNLFGTVKPQGKLYAGERAKRTVSIVRHLAGYFRTTADAEKRRLREAVQLDIGSILQEHWRVHEAHWKRESDLVLDKALQMHRKPEELPRDWHAKLTEARDHLNRIEAERDAFLKDGTWPVTPLRLLFAEAFAATPSGFDIVIANPPYVRQELIRKLKPQLEEEFDSFFCGTADLYTYFYKRGLDLLREGGVLCYIAPNKFMRAAYGANTRKLLTSNATPELIIDFGDLPIFEATTYPAILLIKKETPAGNKETTVAVMKDESKLGHLDETIKSESFAMQVQDLSETGWTLERPEVLRLMNKLRGTGVPLGEYVKGRFYRGILTGFNKAFVIDEATRRQLIKDDPRSAELIKPWLRGRDIKKWSAEWAKQYVLYIPWECPLNKYVAVKNHLLQFKAELSRRPEVEEGRYPWYALGRYAAEYHAEFERRKIVWGNLATRPKFAIEEKPHYISAPANLIPSEDLYLLGLLNSTICSFLVSFLAAVRGGSFLEFKPMYIEQMPVLLPSKSQKSPIVKHVESILTDPSSPKASILESHIDELLFDLYGLTCSERQLICNQVRPQSDGDDTEVEDPD
ncbi:MAG: Eco57I restriction-modification methylase domain-containing protein [Nitrospira sp.]|nr:Eco57I restriction-modification methylase domain-containing protein [Nitrospira sp.]